MEAMNGVKLSKTKGEPVDFDEEGAVRDKVEVAQEVCTDDSDPSRNDNDDDDRSPSCLATVCLMVSNIIPYGGSLSTCFNVSSTILGGGILGLPSSFLKVGISMAVVYLVLISAESVYSIKLLVQASEKSGCTTLESLAAALLHPRMGIFVGVVRAVFCFGACVAYVIAVSDIVSAFITNSSNVPEYLTTTSGTRLIQSMAWLVCMLPLVVPREINSLRYVSAVGVTFILYFAIIIVVHSCMNGIQQDPRPETVIFNTGNEAIQGLGAFIFSFVNQFNCLDIYAEMLNRSLSRFLLCCAVSVSLCCGIYIMSGLFGYLDFGPKASTSLLKLYNPIAEPQVLVSFIGVFIKLCASYGLLANGCRNSIYHLLSWDPMTVVFWKHLITVLIISLLALILGLFVPDINMVFDFVGGVCGGFIGFILPAMFIMYAGNWTLQSVGIVNYAATYLVFFAGVVAVVFGTGSTIYSAV